MGPVACDGTGAKMRWRHIIGAADAATVLELADKTEHRQSQGVAGEQPLQQTGAEMRWRHIIGAADAATVLELADKTEHRQSQG